MLKEKLRYISTITLLIMLAIVPVVHAQQSSSTNYSVNEIFFGSGGSLQDCSATYCAKSSVGETAAGNTKSTSYQAQAGFNTDRTPSLTFIVNTSSINIGIITPGTTKTATATFSVKSYLSSGYVVQTYGSAPTYAGHPLSPLTSATASNSSAEQFGINLVANTSPVSLGANPSQAPDSTFSFGAASAGYNTTNLYKYNSGDTVAFSNSSSGETDYTVSYIFNATGLTPAGLYTTQQSLVATATF